MHPRQDEVVNNSNQVVTDQKGFIGHMMVKCHLCSQCRNRNTGRIVNTPWCCKVLQCMLMLNS